MMRALWSGVSGLTSHQVAMDVESNNISNVNTVGFKYSRTNFQDLMSQNMGPATAPQGKMGGTNAKQVGNGGTVANIQQIFSQGSTQTTDKNTDLAVNGDGFFIVSGNGGKSYSYTRAGNFTFDAKGNLTNPEGKLVQGWIADSNYEIDSTKGLQNITVDPGMTTPAKSTTKIAVIANLNAGTTVKDTERSNATTSIRLDDDMGRIYDYKGREIKLKDNIDVLSLTLKRTYDVAGTAVDSSATYTFTYGKSVNDSDGYFKTIQELLNEINFKIKDSTGIHDNKVIMTGTGEISTAGHLVSVNTGSTPKIADSSIDFSVIKTQDNKNANLTTGQKIKVTFDSSTGLSSKTYTYGTDFTTTGNLLTAINTSITSTTSIPTSSFTASNFTDTGNVLSTVNTVSDSTGVVVTVSFDTSTALADTTYTLGTDFTSTADLLTAINSTLGAAGSVSLSSATGTEAIPTSSFSKSNFTDADSVLSTVSTVADSTGTIAITVDFATSTGLATTTYTSGTDFRSSAELLAAVNATLGAAGSVSLASTSSVTFDGGSGIFKDDAGLLDNISTLDSTGSNPVPGTALAILDGLFSTVGGAGTKSKSLRSNDSFEKPTTNSVLAELFEKGTGGNFRTYELKRSQNSFAGSDDVGELFNTDGDAIQLKAGQGVKFTVDHLGETRNFVYREPATTNEDSYISNNYQNSADIGLSDENQSFRWMYDSAGSPAFMTTGQKIVINFDTSTGLSNKVYEYGANGGIQTIKELITSINSDLNSAGVNASDYIEFNSITGTISDNANILKKMSVTDSTGTPPAVTSSPLYKLNKIFSLIDSTVNNSTYSFKKNDTYYFTNMQELANLYQDSLDDAADKLNYYTPIDGTVSISDDGQITIANNSSSAFSMTTSGYPNNIDSNQLFNSSMSSLSGTVASGAKAYTQRMFEASLKTGVEVFDSSGTKHQVTIHFRKYETSQDNTKPTVWRFYAEAPEPSTFEYPSFGEVKMNLDGSLSSFNPPSVTLNANTGASSGQIIKLDFGSINGFNGLTSFAEPSESKVTPIQDGYAGGSLKDLSVDQTGTIIGGFSNGQSFRLGQVGLATFTNNEGLVKEGGNLFSTSPNSGVPNVGTAGSGNRGLVSSKTLEMSNVDLSKSLTSLIVIQRGFQANSKTITTSDQMLQTLLQLKT